MQVKVLGPVVFGGEEIAGHLRAPKPCRVLALLMLNTGRVVSRSQFTEELWGYDLPPSSSATLQDYVSQVRKALAPLAPAGADVRRDVLVTAQNGYSLRLAESETDVYRFRRLSERGQRALMAGHDELARQLLGSALDLWRGDPLAEIVPGTVLGSYVESLEHDRLRVIEQRIEADLRLGRQHEVIGELSSLVRGHPTNELMYRQYMLALYRAGRRAEALSVYRDLRGHLVRELDVEPSRELQSLHQGILASNPDLDPAPMVVGGRRTYDS